VDGASVKLGSVDYEEIAREKIYAGTGVPARFYNGALTLDYSLLDTVDEKD
jgi:hypothetical protein